MISEPIALHTASTAPRSSHSGCSCGHDDENTIVLDARVIPHAVRHAAIIGALDSLAEGVSMDLVAPHDPLPLLAQIQRRSPEQYSVGYLQEGPEKWVLRLTRRPAS